MQMRLTKTNYARLRKDAHDQDTSMAQVMRDILDAYLADPFSLHESHASERVEGRFDEDSLKQLDQHAQKFGLSRGQAVRQILEHHFGA